MNDKSLRFYSTADIHVAAALLCIGHKLEDVRRSQPKFGHRAKAIFCFQESDALESDILDYTNDLIEVSPRMLFSRLRELKSMVHNLS